MDFDAFLQKTYGFETSKWEEAREWMMRMLHAVARRQSKITYSEICAALLEAQGTRLEPHGTPLAGMLGQINVLERDRGRPLISCVVVHKADDWLPGVGFWNMAKEMGLRIGDSEDARVAYWARELNQCHAYWKGRY